MGKSLEKQMRDMKEQLYMHIGACSQCNTALNEKRGQACEIGVKLSYRWLEFRHKHGDKSATYILDQLKETGARKI